MDTLKYMYLGTHVSSLTPSICKLSQVDVMSHLLPWNVGFRGTIFVLFFFPHLRKLWRNALAFSNALASHIPFLAQVLVTLPRVSNICMSNSDYKAPGLDSYWPLGFLRSLVTSLMLKQIMPGLCSEDWGNGTTTNHAENKTRLCCND